MAVIPVIRNATVTKGMCGGELNVRFYLHYVCGCTVLGWEGVTFSFFFFSPITIVTEKKMNYQNKYIRLGSQLAYVAVWSAHSSRELHPRNGQGLGPDLGMN